MPSRRLRSILAVAAACSALAACSTEGPSLTQVKLATESGERNTGEITAEWLASEMGVASDASLQRYVAAVGDRLVRRAPARSLPYRFQVLDDAASNAYSLSGGAIFVTRGLLALASSEDELASTLAHEIGHVARQHVAARRAIGRPAADSVIRRPLLETAAHDREQELEADRVGQEIVAAAGYDPGAAAAMLHKIDLLERLDVTNSFVPPYFRTHPGSAERAAALAAAAQQSSFVRAEPVARGRYAYLDEIAGLVVGDVDPDQGMLVGRELMFPTLGVVMRLPLMGGLLDSSNRRVTTTWRMPARSIRIDVLAPAADPEVESRAFVASAPGRGIRVVQDQPYELDGKTARRVRVKIEGEKIWADHTWFRFGGRTYHIAAASQSGEPALRLFGDADAITHGFRDFTPADRDALRVERLRLVAAREGETLAELSRRSGSAWSLALTAAHNGIMSDARLNAGQLVKIAVSEPYATPARNR